MHLKTEQKLIDLKTTMGCISHPLGYIIKEKIITSVGRYAEKLNLHMLLQGM